MVRFLFMMSFVPPSWWSLSSSWSSSPWFLSSPSCESVLAVVSCNWSWPSLTIHPDSCCTMIVTWPTSSFPISRQAGLEEVQLLRHGLERHLRRYLTKKTQDSWQCRRLFFYFIQIFITSECGSTTHSNSRLLPSLKLNISPENSPQKEAHWNQPLIFKGKNLHFGEGTWVILGSKQFM